MVVNEVTSSVQAKGTKTVIATAVAALVAGSAMAGDESSTEPTELKGNVSAEYTIDGTKVTVVDNIALVDGAKITVDSDQTVNYDFAVQGSNATLNVAKKDGKAELTTNNFSMSNGKVTVTGSVDKTTNTSVNFSKNGTSID